MLAASVALCLGGCTLIVDPDTRRLDPEGEPVGAVSADASAPAQCPGAAEAWCGDSCVSLESDAHHCGACGVRCARGAECVAGECACRRDRVVEDGRCVRSRER